MLIREKRIGGEPCYEIVEEVPFATGTEYRVVVSLGSESDPEQARRRRHANLLSLERSLQRIAPLSGSDAQIARRCDTLRHRIGREKEKIALLSSAIETLRELPSEADAGENKESNIHELRLVTSTRSVSKPTDSDEYNPTAKLFLNAAMFPSPRNKKDREVSDMFDPRPIAAAIVIALVSLTIGQAKAESFEIGKVEELQLALYGTPAGGESGRLYKNDSVYADELLETVKKSSAQIRFIDDTDLWLGPSSALTLDSFIFDPDQGTGEMVAELGKGLFRFVSGHMPKERVEILTPVAVIGIRGTDFTVEVADDGATQVTVYSGTVSVAPRGGGAAAAVSAGEAAEVTSPTGNVDVSPASQSAPPASVSGGGGTAAAPGGGGGGGSGGGGGGGGGGH
jgi:uncharacterized membrane protein YgcG